MLKLYDYLESGNGYKVRLLLHQLGRPFERIELDILAGETRTPGFLAKNGNGRVPLLELEDGAIVSSSSSLKKVESKASSRRLTLRSGFFFGSAHCVNWVCAFFIAWAML